MIAILVKIHNFVEVDCKMQNRGIMNRLLAGIIFFGMVVLLSACASQRWVAVPDDVDKVQLVKEKFPDIAERCEAGEIEILKLEQRIDKDDKLHYRVTYGRVANEQDDEDEFLWQTIYLPMLTD